MAFGSKILVGVDEGVSQCKRTIRKATQMSSSQIGFPVIGVTEPNEKEKAELPSEGAYLVVCVGIAAGSAVRINVHFGCFSAKRCEGGLCLVSSCVVRPARGEK